MPEAAETEDGIWIDGERFTDNDLTYAEQHEMRRIIRSFHEDDPGFDPGDAAMIDIVPALVTVVKRRTEKNYKVEQALQVKPSDLEKPSGRPTKRRS